MISPDQRSWRVVQALKAAWRLAEEVLRLAWEGRIELGRHVREHVQIVAITLAVAVLVGVPLGILATRSRRLEGWIVGVANVLQTIPSLAMLGFLLILYHTIGNLPAITALVLYALLPIIKNTILGIRAVDPALVEAGRGMGMTPGQLLRMVELPLAVPVIMGGIRVAAVIAVGIATIAAAVGADGLGVYIFRGLSSSDQRQILLGAVPAALLAVLLDLLLGGLERGLTPARGGRAAAAGRASLFRRLGLGAGGVTLLILAGLAAQAGLESVATEQITIGSKDFTEQVILANMLADLVEARLPGLRVRRKLYLGGNMCFTALREGALDAYVEYTGTGLVAILHEPPLHDAAAVYRRVAERFRADYGLVWLEPLGFNNSFAMIVRDDPASRFRPRKISDLQAYETTLRAGFYYEFARRADGWPGLARTYDLHLAHPPREMELGLMYGALKEGAVDLIAGEATDGRIAHFHFRVLDDDRRYFPPYDAAPVVRAATLRRYPQLRAVFQLIAGRLSADTMRRLNAAVDVQHENPDRVAHRFLVEEGLLPTARNP